MKSHHSNHLSSTPSPHKIRYKKYTQSTDKPNQKYHRFKHSPLTRLTTTQAATPPCHSSGWLHPCKATTLVHISRVCGSIVLSISSEGKNQVSRKCGPVAPLVQWRKGGDGLRYCSMEQFLSLLYTALAFFMFQIFASVNTAFVFFMFRIFAITTDIHSICIFCKHSICIFCKHLHGICIFYVPDFCHHYCSITDRESHPYIFIMMNLHPVNVAHCSTRYYTVQISFSSSLQNKQYCSK